MSRQTNGYDRVPPRAGDRRPWPSPAAGPDDSDDALRAHAADMRRVRRDAGAGAPAARRPARPCARKRRCRRPEPSGGGRRSARGPKRRAPPDSRSRCLQGIAAAYRRRALSVGLAGAWWRSVAPGRYLVRRARRAARVSPVGARAFPAALACRSCSSLAACLIVAPLARLPRDGRRTIKCSVASSCPPALGRSAALRRSTQSTNPRVRVVRSVRL